MKSRLWLAVAVVVGLNTAWGDEPVQRVLPPDPQNPNSYAPQVQPKPMPPEETQTIPGQGVTAPTALNPNGLPEVEAFVKAYQNRRSPRLMVFVNRTIQGDILPKDGLEELIRVEEKQTATGGVKVSDEHSTGKQSNVAIASGGYGGTVAGTGSSNASTVNKDSFESKGPAEFSRTTSVKVAPDKLDEIGASRSDYDMIELSLTDYLDCGGRVLVKDSELVRGKMDREKILRLENSDPAAVRLLNTELQTDVLVQVKATPTRQSQWPGGAVRLLAKVMSTTDGRILSSSFVDMPLPMTKPNINLFTRYLAEKMMQKLTAVWSGNPEWDPLEMRIYKAAGVDDTITIRRFLQKLPGVQRVNTQGATGSSATAYATLSIAYNGAPEDLYADLKDALKTSSGLKAVDLSGNTIDVEVTGPMNLVTTTRTTETKTTVETNTTEVKTVEPIRPAPANGGQ